MTRAIVLAVVVVVAVNAAFFASGAVVGGPSGKPASSLSTTGAGFAAWAELARRDGARVTAERSPLTDARLPDGATVVALDVPELSDRAARRLRAFAAAGGTVVAGGDDPERWIGTLAPGLRWRSGGAPAVRPERRAAGTGGASGSTAGGTGGASGAAPVTREIAGVRVVRAPRGGRWSGAVGTPALGTADAALLVVRPLGAGRLVLLADASPLTNRYLGRADNAALALGLSGRTVIFAEAEHGYGATGIAAIPDAAKWALGLLLAAALALIAARVRRFGPAELPARPLPPPRAAYVDAVAATLARARDPAGASAPLRAASLRALRVDADADEAAIRAAATAAGLDDAAAATLVAPARDDDQVLALAGTHATLIRPPGGPDQGRTP